MKGRHNKERKRRGEEGEGGREAKGEGKGKERKKGKVKGLQPPKFGTLSSPLCDRQQHSCNNCLVISDFKKPIPST
jgi:hypothetical protein